MKFIVDECTGPKVARHLRNKGHDVFSVYEDSRGISDDQVIAIAAEQERILITNDKDFGDKVFRSGEKHFGVVLLRLKNETAQQKIKTVDRLIKEFGREIEGKFLVATEKKARLTKKE